MLREQTLSAASGAIVAENVPESYFKSKPIVSCFETRIKKKDPYGPCSRYCPGVQPKTFLKVR